jgi:AcrR family transcriptional regulator
MSNSRATVPTRPRLSKEVQDDFRRRRITDALAEECMARGYRATTITHVVSRAGSSRSTFYTYFANAEDIFLALLARVIGELEEQVDLACSQAGIVVRERVAAGLGAVLNWVSSDSPAAYALLVEAPSVSPAAFDLQLDLQARFTERFRDLAPPDSERPDSVEELLIDGVFSILRYLLVAGEAKRAPDLLASLCTFLEQPYV